MTAFVRCIFALGFVLVTIPKKTYAQTSTAAASTANQVSSEAPRRWGLTQPLVAESTATNKTIRNVKIEIRDIFDEPDPAWFYDAVNGIKVNTKEYIVRQELLFKEGDSFNEFLIEESERSLRRLPFLRKISITPLIEGDSVDILVSVQDTWTLFPFLGFSIGGGANKSSVGIAETNLLGFGKRLEVLYADDEGREKIEGVYDDRRVLGSDHQLTAGIFERSDGYRGIGYYGRPFRSLVEPYSWNFNIEAYDLVGKLFEDGEESFLYREKKQAFSAGLTAAFGEPTERVNRFMIGYDYSISKFEEATNADFDDVDVDPDSVSRDPTLLASDREFSGPFIGLQSIRPDFVSMNFLDRFDRVEDYNLGNEFLARLTAALDALGSERDTFLYNFSDADGYRLSPTAFLRGKLGITGRVDTEEFSNTIGSADLRLYNVSGAKYLGKTYMGKYTFVASMELDVADRLDRDKQLILGASSGLRGYDTRGFTGEQRLIFNIEERVHLVEDLYHLLNVGAAVFFDAGGTSEQGVGDILDHQLHSDVGFGLRIGFPRSSGGSVLRIDIAFPLRDADDGTTKFEPRLLLTTGQAVTARLPNESDQGQGSNVTVKFLP